MPGMIIGALASLAGSAINAANQHAVNAQNQRYTRENMRLQNVLNKDEKSFQDTLNRQYQDFLWRNQYSKGTSGMKAAGLNPADNGTSIGGMSASNNVSAGPSGPAAHGSMADLTGSAVQGLSIYKELEMLDAQKKNIEADTNAKNASARKQQAEAAYQEWMNTPGYQKLVESGMQSSAIRDVYMAYKASSDVEVNDATIEKTNAEVLRLASLSGLDKAQTAKALQDVAESKVRIAEMYQGMSESKARRTYYIEASRAQAAAAEEYRANAKYREAQTKTEDQMRDVNKENVESQTQLNKEHGEESKSRIKLNERELELKGMILREYQVFTPEDRAGLAYGNAVVDLLSPDFLHLSGYRKLK